MIYDHRTYQIIELPKEGYINLGLRGNGKIEFAPSTYCRHWTIQDAKDGDVLCYKDEISLYKHDIKNCAKQETTFGGFVYHCCYDGKRFITDSLYSLTEQDKMDIHPATKEQRDQLEKAMVNAGYTFDFEKKELKKIEQNPAWSEEDEKMLNDAIGAVGIADYYTYDDKQEIENWLKSLRPQNTWKPSDEQMKALEHFVRSIGESGYASSYDNNTKLVYSLLSELKKLREE